MQLMSVDIIKKSRKEKIQKLEIKIREILIANIGGVLFICPYCNYESKKNPKGSSKIFQDKFFKCFACGIWRSL